MKRNYLYLLFIQAFLILGNSINSDAQQVAKRTSSGTGYLEHLPPDYATNTTKKYPVMFFLHGAGETGTGSAADLEKLKVAGPPKEMKNGHNMCFTVNGVEECFIVISPQLGAGVGGWWAGILAGVFDYVMTGPENYRIDKDRVYLTGLSMGGNGVYNGAGATTDIFAAAGVIAGFNNGYGCTISARKIPMWGFHGESDGTIPYATGLANFQAITSCTSPVPTAEYKWTSYPGVGHNAWDRAYTTTHTYHNPNLYEWLLTKSKSNLPVANAGSDKSIVLPTNSVSLVGSGTDSGGISSYSWQKITGGAATITNATSSTATVSGLVEGVYTFRLTVTDNSGNPASDDVTVTVNAVALNVPPVITLSASMTLTLPTNTTNIVGLASDTDGSVVSYLWSQQSGPSTAALSGVTGATVSASGLIAGTYTFRLTVTDDDAASSFKEINVVVNPAAANQLPIAQAGTDKSITLPTNSLNLTGSGSDGDGSISSYLWEKVTGPAAVLANANTPILSLTSLVAGVYTFRLTVFDNLAARGSDEVTVTVTGSNQAPTANANSDVVITLPTNSVTLGGSGSDLEGWITAYLWTQVSGPSASTLTNAASYAVSVSNLVAGVYVYRLTVTDNSTATGSDEVKVTVNASTINSVPVANAGQDKSITLPVNSVVLDGTGTDSDGSIASYSWIKLTGSSVTLTNQNTPSLTVSSLVAGSYSFQLTVTDNNGAPSTDVVNVTVQPAVVNQAPIANAGPDKGITLPINSTTLNGGGTDNDGTISLYSWTKQGGPAATLSGESTATLQLSNLLAGIYTFRLTVTDNKGASHFDDAVVTVSAINVIPFANAGPDVFINLPDGLTPIVGDGTDADGTISGYLWASVSGPAPVTINFPTTRILSVSGLVAGTYIFRLTVTDNSGATGFDEVKVVVNALNQIPIANAGVDQLITLPTSTINLTGFGSDNDGTIASYLWTQTGGPAATITNATSPTVSIATFSPNSYVFRLTVTDNLGDSDYDEVTLVVNPATVNLSPTAYAGSNQSLTLPVNSTVLNGSGSDPDGQIVSYQWIKVSGPAVTMTNETTSVLSVSNLVESTYIFRLTVTDNLGLPSSSDVTVNVLPQAINQTPSAHAGEDEVMTLPTNSITLFGSGSDPDGSLTSYTWSQLSGPVATVANETTSSVSLINLIEGIYVFRLTVEDDKGSSGSDDVTVTVNALGINQRPLPNAGPDLIVNLPNSTATLEGSASDADGSIVSYFWTKLSGPPATLTNTSNAILTVSNLVEGNYSFLLSVSDNNGAEASDEMTLTVLPATINQSPIVDAGTSVSLILPANSTKLIGTASDADGSIVSYQWTKIAGGAATLQDSDKPTLILTDLVAGDYLFRLTATDDKEAIGTDEVYLEVKPAGSNTAPIANAGSDLSIKLPLNSVIINGLGTDEDGSIATYLWEKTSGPSALLSNANTQSLTVSSMLEGVYSFSFTVTDDGGLVASDEVKVVVLSQSLNLSPIANAGQNISITLPDNSVVINGSGTDADGSITSYLWSKVSGPSAIESGGATSTLSVTALVEGTYIYRLTVTDNNGSTSSDEMVIMVNPDITSLLEQGDAPIAHAGPDQILQPGTLSTKLIASFEDTGIVNRFSWKQISGDPVLLDGQDRDTLSVSGFSKGTYIFELTVFNLFGKSGSDEVEVSISDELIVNYKKFFSPNGDGQNDFWELDPDISQFANSKLIIFDSHGVRLFSTNSYQNNWDGIFNGVPLPEDAYYFVLEAGGRKKTGSITLIR